MPVNNIFSRAMRRGNQAAPTTTPSWANLFGGTAPGGLTPYSAPAQAAPPPPVVAGAQTGATVATPPIEVAPAPTPTVTQIPPTIEVASAPTPTVTQQSQPTITRAELGGMVTDFMNQNSTSQLPTPGTLGPNTTQTIDTAVTPDPTRAELGGMVTDFMNQTTSNLPTVGQWGTINALDALDVAPPTGPVMSMGDPVVGVIPEPAVTQLPQGTIADASLDPSNYNRPVLSSVETSTLPRSDSNLGVNWITEGQQLAEDFNTEGLRTGKFGAVESAKGAAERNSSLRRSVALQRANDVAMRAGYQPGTAQYQAVFDRALGEANMANLDERNSALGLQRSYVQDALTRAGDFEKGQYERSIGEREHAESRSDVMYNRARIEKLEGKADVERYLTTIDNPIARQFLENAWAESGGDVARFRAEAATIFEDSGMLNQQYRDYAATIPRSDIEAKWRTNTSGAINPDTGLAWTGQAEKDAYIEKHTTETYSGMINTEYAPVTEEQRTATQLEALTADFNKGTKTDAQYLESILSAAPEEWQALTQAQYATVVNAMEAGGLIKPYTIVPANTNLMNTYGSGVKWMEDNQIKFTENGDGSTATISPGQYIRDKSGNMLELTQLVTVYSDGGYWNQANRTTVVVGIDKLTGNQVNVYYENHTVS